MNFYYDPVLGLQYININDYPKPKDKKLHKDTLQVIINIIFHKTNEKITQYFIT